MTPAPAQSPSGRSPGLLAVAILCAALVLLPALIATWWTQLPGFKPQAFFFPVEILGVLLPTLAVAAGSAARESLRWRAAPSRVVGLAALGALGWGALLTYVQTGWQQVTGIAPPPGLEAFLAIRTPQDALLLVLAAAVTPALCEETAFRGFIMSRLERWGPVPAIAATAVLFAVYHQEPYGVPTYLGLGMFLGWVAWRTGSLWPSVAAHAANNVLALAQVNGVPETWWWEHASILVPLAAVIAGAATWALEKGPKP